MNGAARSDNSFGVDQADRRRRIKRLQPFGPTEFGVHQVLAAASPGDAITNAALEYRSVLRRIGPSEIFARHIAPSSASEVQPLSAYRACGSHGVLVYHASIGEPTVEAFLCSRHEPIVLVYHNITPARYFEGLNDTFAELLVLGRAELESIRPRVARAIAASHFNAAELEAIGYDDVRVIPPVVDPLRLVRTIPDAAMTEYLDEAIREPVLLFVGQLLPHKRPDLLVEAMHVATTYLDLTTTLLLVGQHGFPRYADAIRAQVRELNIRQVHVVGPVGDAQLAAMFRRAAAFVTMSEHEGFCVPLLEAMAFDVPVVARACAAIPETVGDAGLLLPAWAGSELIAEAIVRVIGDTALRTDLVDRGRRRLGELTAIDASVAMLETIGEVI